MNNPDPAQIVRNRRHDLGLTQTVLAARLGVTLRAVQYWEAGTRRPTKTAMKLLKTLPVPKKKETTNARREDLV